MYMYSNAQIQFISIKIQINRYLPNYITKQSNDRYKNTKKISAQGKNIKINKK